MEYESRVTRRSSLKGTCLFFLEIIQLLIIINKLLQKQKICGKQGEFFTKSAATLETNLVDNNSSKVGQVQTKLTIFVELPICN